MIQLSNPLVSSLDIFNLVLFRLAALPVRDGGPFSLLRTMHQEVLSAAHLPNWINHISFFVGLPGQNHC